MRNRMQTSRSGRAHQDSRFTRNGMRRAPVVHSGRNVRRTHQQLNKIVRNMFRDLIVNGDVLSTTKSPLNVLSVPRRGGKVSQAFTYNARNVMELRPRFEEWYRSLISKCDELFSTSTMRSVLEGIVEAAKQTKLTQEQMDQYIAALEKVSEVRLPTEGSGFSLKDQRMQHPTSSLGGYFSATKTGKQHSELDLKRKDVVVSAMEKVFEEQKDLVETLKAGLKAAIAFTLNNFTAPSSAANIKGFSTLADAAWNDLRIIKQVEAREKIKNIFKSLGGEIRDEEAHSANALSVLRDWNPRIDDASTVSPVRDLNDFYKTRLDDDGSVSDKYRPNEYEFRVVESPPTRPVAQPTLRRPMPSRKSQIFHQEGRERIRQPKERQGLKRALGE